jgi:clan AA aspartic protease (TIGR02281 family)
MKNKGLVAAGAVSVLAWASPALAQNHLHQHPPIVFPPQWQPWPPRDAGVNVVPLQARNGAYYIAVIIGGVSRWGILDTGATSVSLSEREAEQLVARGEAHWTGETGSFGDANGHQHSSRFLVIHRLTIGNATLSNVEASTAAGNAPFLIGMSALKRLGTMKLDVQRGQVTFERNA